MAIRHSDFVEFLYEILFEREPGKEGIDYWVRQVKQRGMLAVFQDFLATPEAHNRLKHSGYLAPFFTKPRLELPFPGDDALYGQMRPLRIIDVGALSLDFEEDIYRPLLDSGICEVIGFEPIEEELEKRRVQDPNFVLLPHVVGDGRERVFHRTAAGTTSSLYPPNYAFLEQFLGLSEHIQVVETRPVTTVCLDDIAETEDAVYLKVDVQGAELDVLRGATKRLSSLTILHLEVEFSRLYKDQPLFADVNEFAMAHGFELFDFSHLERYFYRSEKTGFGFPPQRLLWGDAVYVKPLQDVAALERKKLLQTCLVMHTVYRSYDFCSALLDLHDERFGGDFGTIYRAQLEAAEQRRPEPARGSEPTETGSLVALPRSMAAAMRVLQMCRSGGTASTASRAASEAPGDLGPIPQLPLPPLELRKLIGPMEPRYFDNPDGGLAWGDLAVGPLMPGQAYRRIFDFGCGCGRSARQLLLQNVPPERYVGIDISHRMIKWCQKNLKRPGVEVAFHHHVVWSATYAPKNSKNDYLPIRRYGTDFTLINAHSIFTHLLEKQTRFYLREMRSMLAEDGLLRCSWFFFNREWFPVLAPEQHCLYVNERDPSQAVYYDWEFFRELVRELGFKIVDADWTKVSGFQSVLLLAWGEKFEDVSANLEPPETVLGFGPSAPTWTMAEQDPDAHVRRSP